MSPLYRARGEQNYDAAKDLYISDLIKKQSSFGPGISYKIVMMNIIVKQAC